MQLLLSCLRCKDNWLEEFISGLQTCEHSTLASQIQEEFKSLKIQLNGSTLAPMAPTSGGTLLPPHNPSTISTPKMDEAADSATPLPPEILANHTGPSSAVVQFQSGLEPVASEDIGAVSSNVLVTPRTHISSPEVHHPGPQELLMKPDKKLQSASDNPNDSSKSTVGQVLAKDLVSSQSLASPTKDVAGVTASFNVQDVTDGLISLYCLGGTSADEEVCANKPVLLISIHSVQVHQPFDSPSTFQPIGDEGAYSGESGNLGCRSNLSHHTYESVNAESIALSNAENSALSDKEQGAPGDAENVAPSDVDSVSLSNVEKVAIGDVGGVALSDTEAVAPSDTMSVVQGPAESEAFSDATKVAPGEIENVALCDTERVAPADGESKALYNAGRVAPGNVESGAFCDGKKVVPSDIKSEALCDAESIAPGHAKCVTFREKEVLTPHDAEGVFSGDIRSAIGNVESFLPENKNTIVPSDEDGNTESIALYSLENVVCDNNEKVTVNAKQLVGDNTESIVCDEIESSSLEAPESRAETNYCDSAYYDTNTSSRNPESVIHESVGPNNIQNRAADFMENTAPCSMDLGTRDPSYTHLAQNVWKENGCDIAHQVISSPNAPSSNHLHSESLFPSKADNRRESGALCEGDSRAQVISEFGALCNTDSGAPAEGHSEASSEEENGDTESESPGEEDNGATDNPDGGAPVVGESGASGDKDGGAPGEGGSGLPGDRNSGAPGNGDSGASREGDGASTGEGDIGSPGEVESGGPQEEDNAEPAVRDSGAPGKGDAMIPGKQQSGGPGEGGPGEVENKEPEVRNTGTQGEGGDSDATGGIDSRVVDELAVVVPRSTELPQNNSEGNQDFNHIEANFHASLSTHIPKNPVPSDVESATSNVVQTRTPGHLKNEAIHKELVENQYNSTHTDINSPSSALSNHSPEIGCPQGTESTPGDMEPLHLETEENYCSAVHGRINLSSAESFIPSTDSRSSNNMGSQIPSDTSSTHLTIDLTSHASLNHKPDSAANVAMELHTHKPMKNQCSTLCCDIINEQDVEKEFCMSEDLDVQNQTTSGKTPVKVITEKRLEAFSEQGQPILSPLGNYYVPAAIAGVVVAAILWQLKK
ncbi:uncharacterized protein LOC133135408 isoform X1 [Conger conger]|nr:uncharacterized protein LOC133135408 isoform X1 [Conger conger]